MKILIQILVIFSFGSLLAQEPIKWTAEFLSSDKKLVFKAEIEGDWHVYSQFIDPQVGPVPTSFSFEEQAEYKLIGKVEEPSPIVAFDQSFEAEVAYFEKSVRFEQKIDVLKPSSITTRITYMLCNNKTCLPPTETILSINIYP